MNKIFLYTFFQFALFHGPIIIIFYQSYGLSLNEIYLLQTFHSFVKLLSEVPSGMFADHYKRKYALFLGAVLTSFAYLGIYFSKDFLNFALFEIVAGLGRSLISNADSALIYDTLKHKNQLNKYQQFESINFVILNVSFIIYALCSGFIAKVDVALPYLFSALFIAIAALISLTIKEYPHSLETTNEYLNKSTYFEKILMGFKTISFAKNLKFLIIFGAIFLFIREINFYTEQPLLSNIGIPIQFFGILPAIGAAIWALTSYFSSKIIKNIGRNKSFIVVSLFLFIPSLLLGKLNQQFCNLIIYMVYYIAYGLGEPLVRINLNLAIVNSSIRSTVLSIQSALSLFLYCLLAPFFGYLLDIRPLQTGFNVIALLSFSLLIYTLYWGYWGQRKTNLT